MRTHATASDIEPQVLPEANSALRASLLGVGLALIAALGFSGKAILVKLAYQDGVDAVTLLALRVAFSAPVFLIVLVLAPRPAQPVRGPEVLGIVALGLLGYYLSSLLDFEGLQYISAALERLILFLYPTVVVVVSALFARRRLRREEWLALVLSYAGIVLVFLHDLGGTRAGIGLGALLVFGSTLSYSAYLLGADRLIARVGSVRFTAYAMLVSSAFLLGHFVATHPLAALRQPLRVYGLSLAMGAFSTVLPMFALAAAIRRIGSARTSMIGSIGPVFTLLMAAVVLDEGISAIQVGGSALVLGGVLLAGWRASR